MKMLILLLSLLAFVSCKQDGPAENYRLDSSFYGAYSMTEAGTTKDLTIAYSDITIDTTTNGVTTTKTYPYTNYTKVSALVTTDHGLEVWEFSNDPANGMVRMCTPVTGVYVCKVYNH